MEENILAQEAAPEAYIPETRKPLRPEWILAIIAGSLAVIALVLTVLAIPYFGQKPQEEDPQQLLQGGHAATMPQLPTEAPGEILPEPEKSPYGPLDFQYKGRYLGCIKAGTIPGVDVSYYQGDID